jgi:hypothetical protein
MCVMQIWKQIKKNVRKNGHVIFLKCSFEVNCIYIYKLFSIATEAKSSYTNFRWASKMKTNLNYSPLSPPIRTYKNLPKILRQWHGQQEPNSQISCWCNNLWGNEDLDPLKKWGTRFTNTLGKPRGILKNLGWKAFQKPPTKVESKVAS